MFYFGGTNSIWGKVAESRMPALRVVEGLDIREDRQPSFVPGLEGLSPGELSLDASHEALGGGVVESVALRAHRGHYPRLLERLSDGQRPVLAAPV